MSTPTWFTAAYENEVERRKVERKLERLDGKIASGHANLAGYRDRAAAKLREREAIARANEERREQLGAMAKTLEDPLAGDAA